MSQLKFPNLDLDKPKTYHNDELEAYKQLRTNIEFTSLDTSLQVLAVTSADAAEAKTTTSVNLAKVMAAQKNKVLLKTRFWKRLQKMGKRKRPEGR